MKIKNQIKFLIKKINILNLVLKIIYKKIKNQIEFLI